MHLNCYKLACEAFDQFNWQKNKDQELHSFRIQILAKLCAGYYSYEYTIKYNYYSQARAFVGSVLAYLLSHKNLREQWKIEINFIEQKLLPALSALIRNMEKKIK